MWMILSDLPIVWVGVVYSPHVAFFQLPRFGGFELRIEVYNHELNQVMFLQCFFLINRYLISD